MSRQARKYDKTFKTNAVKLFHESKKKATEIAQNLGIPESTLQTWIKEYKTNGDCPVSLECQAMLRLGHYQRNPAKRSD